MYQNYYFYTNGNKTTSNIYYDEAMVRQIAHLVFQNDSIQTIYTINAETGEIIHSLEK